jgi:hypothetical protein
VESGKVGRLPPERNTSQNNSGKEIPRTASTARQSRFLSRKKQRESSRNSNFIKPPKITAFGSVLFVPAILYVLGGNGKDIKDCRDKKDAKHKFPI